jgi:hypothetical protein
MEDPIHRPEAIFVGKLSEIASRLYCPFCRLLRQCAIEEYSAFITDNFLIRESGEEIPCHLDTLTADWNQSDLDDPKAAGPAAWYLGLLLGDLRSSVKTWPRYLVLDAKDTPLVVPGWSYDQVIDEQEQDQETILQKRTVGSITMGVPRLEGEPEVYFYSGREVGEYVDFGLLKDYYAYCAEHHTDCWQRKPQDVISYGLKLIDVERRLVVKAPADCEYFALSYVWGSIKVNTSSEALPEALPRTIEDAIVVTMRLGGLYLWIDAFCIPQDDQGEKAAQIQLMDQIYNNASLTIIAGEGVDSNAGLTGVGPDIPRRRQYRELVDNLTIYVSTPLLKESLLPENEVAEGNSDSAVTKSNRYWSARGWTFQEGLLSSRCMVFTRNQVFWKCRKEFLCESLAETPRNQREAMSTARSQCEILASPKILFYEPPNKTETLLLHTDSYYFEAVEGYSKRSLTVENDRLDAFTGLATALLRGTSSDMFWGLSEDIFDATLLWTPLNMNQDKPRNFHFPSWSWLSWPGSVSFIVYQPQVLARRSFQDWNLGHGMLRVRRRHPYWKYDSMGHPSKIKQTFTRYSLDTERKEGLVSERGDIYLVRRNKLASSGVVTWTEFMEGKIEQQSPPQSLNCTSLPAFSSLNNGSLPLLYFQTSMALFRLTSTTAKGTTNSSLLRVGLEVWWGEVQLHCTGDDEYFWLDTFRDMARLEGHDCKVVLLSSLETPERITFMVMAIEKDDFNCSHRIGIGAISSETWKMASPTDEWVILR